MLVAGPGSVRDVGMPSCVAKQVTPCDHPHHGNTANEVIKAQDRHLNDVVSKGDETHARALKEMKGRWKHPISGIGWYRKAKRDFAALPDD
jgi:hypothetical protein